MNARAGTDIDDIVRSEHCFLVVLDDDDRISRIAQAEKGINQLAVVALMETDTRFVQDIKDIDQLGTDLRGKPDALALTS